MHCLVMSSRRPLSKTWLLRTTPELNISKETVTFTPLAPLQFLSFARCFFMTVSMAARFSLAKIGVDFFLTHFLLKGLLADGLVDFFFGTRRATFLTTVVTLDGFAMGFVLRTGTGLLT